MPYEVVLFVPERNFVLRKTLGKTEARKIHQQLFPVYLFILDYPFSPTNCYNGQVRFPNEKSKNGA